jgi:hypothetical protein
MYIIEKGIPLKREVRQGKYPFNLMEVGDSFFVECSTKKISPLSHSFGKRHNMKFAVRKENEGTRVFRTQ